MAEQIVAFSNPSCIKTITLKKVKRFGAPGALESVPVNFLRRLSAILEVEALEGALDDAAAAQPAALVASSSSAASSTHQGHASAWTLATHGVDQLLDAALVLWRAVQPLLAQLDASPAQDPLRLGASVSRGQCRRSCRPIVVSLSQGSQV